MLARFTDLQTRDVSSLLDLSGDFSVSEFAVDLDDWVAERPLARVALRDEGIVVLAMTRSDGRHLTAPTGSTVVWVGDLLVLYMGARTPWRSSMAASRGRKATRSTPPRWCARNTKKDSKRPVPASTAANRSDEAMRSVETLGPPRARSARLFRRATRTGRGLGAAGQSGGPHRLATHVDSHGPA